MKTKSGMKYDPTTWAIKCDGENCKDHVIFDNYNNFQNARSRIKKGQLIFCLCCKQSKKIVSDNPDDWKIKCKSCDNFIVYDNPESFRQMYYRSTIKGDGINCPACNKELYKTRIRKDAIYSRNPDDWELPCSNDGCRRMIVYTTLKGYQRSAKLFNEGNGPHCYSCVSKRFDHSDPSYRSKFIGRKLPELVIEKMRFTKANRSVEEKELTRSKQSSSAKRRWENMSDEQRQKAISYLSSFITDMQPEEYERWRRHLSDLAKARAKLIGNRLGFQPGYNFDTIPYIDDVLQFTYNTKFVHAENSDTEFKIFDDYTKSYYYADAYSPELNLWIEFDEKYKFTHGRLIDIHIRRHHRIKKILNCDIVRIKVHKNYRTPKCVKFDEYYNDLTGVDYYNINMHWNNITMFQKQIKSIKRL